MFAKRFLVVAPIEFLLTLSAVFITSEIFKIKQVSPEASVVMPEIRKAGFVNKGAELMLYAILEKLRGEFPNIKFCMAPHPVTAKFEKRIELNLFQKPDIWYFNMQLGLFFNLLPKFIRDMYGIVVDNEVDIVLDTAGFAYGDTWNIKGLKNLADRCVKRKKYGTKILFGLYRQNGRNGSCGSSCSARVGF